MSHLIVKPIKIIPIAVMFLSHPVAPIKSILKFCNSCRAPSLSQIAVTLLPHPVAPINSISVAVTPTMHQVYLSWFTLLSPSYYCKLSWESGIWNWARTFTNISPNPNLVVSKLKYQGAHCLFIRKSASDNFLPFLVHLSWKCFLSGCMSVW